MNKKKVLLVLAVFSLIVLFFALGGPAWFDLENFQARRQALQAQVDARFLSSAALYFAAYTLVAALSLPAAAVLTVIGGALFGLGWGLVLVSFASSIGATLAFLAARTVLRDWTRARFGSRMEVIDRGIEKDGAFYLLSLRLVPLVPFFMVNLGMALTSLRTRTYYLVSQVGMLPGTLLYVNVGVQLGDADSLPEVLGPAVLLSLLAAALFPWLAKALLDFRERRRVYQNFGRPRRFDANLLVIGAGSAGLVCAYIGALLKARVVLIEKQRMGGDCLNTGCVPSKALIRSAQVRHLLGRAKDFGVGANAGDVDFKRVMERVREAIATIAPHDSMERYTKLGVECVQGEARLSSPWTVEVNGRTISARAIILATGASPRIPSIPGLEGSGYVTSDTVWNLRRLPRRLLVLGAGPLGCELAQAFARLGSQVTLLDRAPRPLPREDAEVGDLLAHGFEAEGIRLMMGFHLSRISRSGEVKVAFASNGGGTVDLRFDELLLATGRTPNLEGLGLEALGIERDDRGELTVDGFLRTRFPNILACGDAAGPFRFTHMAAFQAWYASINGLFGLPRPFRVNYSVVPWAVFTDPEVARVGLSETEARERGVAFETVRYEMADLDRAIVDGEARGFVKVLTPPGRDRILGALIVGAHAAELLQPFVLAMTHRLGLKKLMSTIHIYPGWMEANRHVAGEWRKRHAPRWLFPWLERYHRWRRG